MFPHVVTLYNVVTEEDPSTFEETTTNHITILRGVLLDAVKAKTLTKAVWLERMQSTSIFRPALKP